MFKEFKEFALKGNLIDLAVAFVMGAAFTQLSQSFIQDLVMPPIAMLSKGADFSNMFYGLTAAVTETADLAAAREQGPVLAYGNFITLAINFLLVSLAMFFVVKGINRARRSMAKDPEPAAPDAPTTQELLLMEIRDALTSQNPKN